MATLNIGKAMCRVNEVQSMPTTMLPEPSLKDGNRLMFSVPWAFGIHVMKIKDVFEARVIFKDGLGIFLFKAMPIEFTSDCKLTLQLTGAIEYGEPE